MTTTTGRKCWGWSGVLVLGAAIALTGDEALRADEAPAGAVQAAPQTDLAAEAPPAGSQETTPGTASPSAPEGAVTPSPGGSSDSSGGLQPPAPIHEGAAHSPGTAFGRGPYGTLGHPGWVQYPSTWNGYWNYATAYGAPGYTAYWHGWYAGPRYDDWYGPWWVGGGWPAGPYWDYAWPTWSHHGWGYSSVGWGWGHSHRYYPWAYAPCQGRWGMIRRW